MNHSAGHQMYRWADELFPICRSISGNGVRSTLTYIADLLPQLQVHEVATGTSVFDWTVPNEWNIRDAFVTDGNGHRIIDFNRSNLHVVGYSEPIDLWMSFAELDQHLYSLPDQPDAVPFVFSYYHRRWGFCLTDRQRDALRADPHARYHVKIDSTLRPGAITYGDLIIPGTTSDEVLFSTYICHPSLANDNLSGIVVTTALARWIHDNSKPPRYTYRFIFIPETIGSIIYLHLHGQHMRQSVCAGYVVTCVGDSREYSYVASRNGDSLADRVAKHVLRYHAPEYRQYSFLDRGSDERQYCSPGFDLPVCVICRSKFGSFPEYHCSLDDMDLVSPDGLEGSLAVLQKTVSLLENNHVYRCTVTCEPQLGRRGLYPTLSTKESYRQARLLVDFLAYVDGEHDVIAIADKINANALNLLPVARQLLDAGLLEIVT